MKLSELDIIKEGEDLLRAILPQPLLLEYDPEKTKKVNAWLDLFHGFKQVWKYFRYEVYMDWDAIILICDKTDTKSLHVYADGRYWWVMAS